MVSSLKEFRAHVLKNPSCTKEELCVRFGITIGSIKNYTTTCGFMRQKETDGRFYWRLTEEAHNVRDISHKFTTKGTLQDNAIELIEAGYDLRSIALHLNTHLYNIICIDRILQLKNAQKFLKKESMSDEIKDIQSPIDKNFYKFPLEVTIERCKFPSVLRKYGIHPDDKPEITRDDIRRRIEQMIQYEVNLQVDYCVNHDAKYFPKNPMDAQFHEPE